MAKSKQSAGLGFAVIIALVVVAGATVAITQDWKTGQNSLVEGLKAQTGDPEAQYRKAISLLNQHGVIGADRQATEWLEKAAGGGHVPAMLKLGDIRNAGSSEADGDAAVAWYDKAAKAGNIEAMRKLGIAYAIGRGRNEPAPDKALPLFETAARAGDDEAKLHLGRMLVTTKRVDEGVTWLTRAGETGQVRAWYVLGDMYYQARNVKKDQERAFGYFARGAEGGEVEAQLLYSFMFLTGRSTKADKAEAYKWLLIADESKSQKTRSAMAYLEPRLSPAEMAEGKKRADAWKAANPRKVPKPAGS
ncbi:tetratricopeptide repeat protein [Asticcacaulis sp. AC402]|uniref:tetratricopeptide repeat protein n=1 Tax=Asticcacaulis sp. AC402 TaxID=1282361 RepID=UPI0003C3ADA9|nr:tetratricopeptide repeat protein [Asticcacaulis sp. AC402]ESQ76071.1 hypothetical protein ABAC402_06390 [Asticcacaulis sp. AC402]